MLNFQLSFKGNLCKNLWQTLYWAVSGTLLIVEAANENLRQKESHSNTAVTHSSKLKKR
jgi:hypothetical protein